ncbi:MAG: gpW family head-tail joining protein [Actinomycetota bacterium]
MTDLTTLQGRLLETELALRKLRTGVREMQVEFGAMRIAYTEAAAEFMANRHLRLAESLDASPGLEAKRNLLKASDADFLAKLGAAGERLQREVDALLAKLAAEPETQASPRATLHRDNIAEQFEFRSAPAGLATWPNTNTPY